MADSLRAVGSYIASGWMQGHTSTFVLWVIAMAAMVAFARTLTRLLVYLSAISVGCLRFRLHALWLAFIWCVVAGVSVWALFVIHDAFSVAGGSGGSSLSECVGAILLLLAGPAGSAFYLLGIRGDARRIRVPGDTARNGRRTRMSKAIVICCDGTGNIGERDAKLGTASNVWRFYDAVLAEAESGWQQTKWYDAGVGTDTSTSSRRLSTIQKILRWAGQDRPGGAVKALGVLRRIIELGVGVGITENITEGYTEIVRRYEPGDRIYLVGFSRGAYTARCIAGVISRAGLLKSDQARFAADVVRLYCGRRQWNEAVNVDPTRIHPKNECNIEFLGVWDTVASLGIPLWGWWFRVGKLWSNQGRIVDTAQPDSAGTCSMRCRSTNAARNSSQRSSTRSPRKLRSRRGLASSRCGSAVRTLVWVAAISIRGCRTSRCAGCSTGRSSAASA
jgi:hypothetical protein